MSEKIGILAGNGDLPKILSNKAEQSFIVGIQGAFDAKDINVDYEIEPLAKFGSILKHFKNNDVKKVVLVGGIGRVDLNNFDCQDSESQELLLRCIKNLGGDNALFTTVVEFINENGFEVIGVEDVIGKQSHKVGNLGDNLPNGINKIDIELGMNILNSQSQYDIGQSVCVQQNNVLALEAVEGTDAMIKRAGKLKSLGEKPVLIKGIKKNQSKQVDLPTIGLHTLDNIVEQGFEGIAVFADGTIILDKEKLIEKANEKGVFVVAI